MSYPPGKLRFAHDSDLHLVEVPFGAIVTGRWVLQNGGKPFPEGKDLTFEGLEGLPFLTLNPKGKIFPLVVEVTVDTRLLNLTAVLREGLFTERTEGMKLLHDFTITFNIVLGDQTIRPKLFFTVVYESTE